MATPNAATPAASGGVADQDSFIDALNACGVTVEPAGTVEQPFLHAESGEILRLRGEGVSASAEIQVFAYPDEESAEADASGIGPDGNPPTMQIEWIQPPHFFQSGRIIVLYLGDDQAMLDLLTALLGPQFAGR